MLFAFVIAPPPLYTFAKTPSELLVRQTSRRRPKLLISLCHGARKLGHVALPPSQLLEKNISFLIYDGDAAFVFYFY